MGNKFNPSLIVPASQIEGFAKSSTARSVKDVALANIDKTKALFLNPEQEGKRNFTINGENVSFTIRVNNTALVLGQYEANGVTADVKEMAVPKAHFVEALDYYKARIAAGEMDAQLFALEGSRTARVEKMRSTRATKKAEPTKA